MAKAKAEGLTVEQAIAASRAKLTADTPSAEETKSPIEEFIEAGPSEAAPAEEDEDLDARLDAAFAKLDGGTPGADTEAKLDPDGTFTFNLTGLPEGPTGAPNGPLVLSDEAPSPPPVDEEAGASDYEPELAFDWDKLSEQTKNEIMAGREALARNR